MATITPNEDFDADAAASVLRAAMQGLGTNEEEITNVMVSHSNEQRNEIAKVYKTAYGEDLIKDLKSELGGNFEDAVIALMAPPRVYDARELNNAISGAGTAEGTLIEIMCTRSNEEIAEIKEKYKAEYKRELEDDLAGDTSGDFKRLMVSQVQGHRDEDDEDDDKAAEDAQAIFDAGEGQWGTDESTLNMVLCRRSWPQLRATFWEYKNIAGKDIEESINDETSGNLKEGFLAIAKVSKDRHEYFAERLYKSMKGLGTDDNGLIRAVVSRSEVDLEDIKEKFQELYEKSLLSFVEDDCAGDYKRLLMAVVRD